MKANELMIGDWVISTLNKAVYQIDPILAYGIIDAVLKNDPDIDNHFEPISLTPEILEKNGFKSVKYGMFTEYIFPNNQDLTNRGFHLEEYDVMYRITDHRLISIRYVHELQHALK